MIKKNIPQTPLKGKLSHQAKGLTASLRFTAKKVVLTHDTLR